MNNKMKTCRACKELFKPNKKYRDYCPECYEELFNNDISPAICSCLNDNKEKSFRQESAYKAQVYRQRMGRAKTDS